MLTVEQLSSTSWASSLRPGRKRAATRRCAGCTSPSCWTRRRGCRGGELLLTTGIQLESDERQREFVRRLVRHGLAGVGFGTGFGHQELPAALLAAAQRAAAARCSRCPTRCRSSRSPRRRSRDSSTSQYEVLQRGIAIHERLEQLVLEERGLEEVMRARRPRRSAARVRCSTAAAARRDERAFRRPARRPSDSVTRPTRERSPTRGTAGTCATRVRAATTRSWPARSVLPVSPAAGRAAQAWLVASATPAGWASSSG